MDIISKYRSDLQYDFNFQKNSLREQINDITPTIGNKPLWANGKSGRKLLLDNTVSYLNYGDNFDIDDARIPFTIAFHGNLQIHQNFNNVTTMFFNKDAGTGSQGCDLWYDNRPAEKRLFFLLGAGVGDYILLRTTQLETEPEADTTYIITYDGSKNGSGFKVYIDNVPQTLSFISNNLTSNDCSSSATFKLGAVYGTWEPNWGMYRLFKFNNRELTAEEVAQLHKELMSSDGVLKSPRRNFAVNIPKDSSAIVEIDNTRMGDKILDHSGNGFHGTITPTITDNKGMIHGDGISGKVVYTGNLGFTNTTEIGLEVVFRLLSNPPSYSQIFGDLGSRVALYVSSTGTVFGQVQLASGVITSTPFLTAVKGKLYHVVVRWKSGEKVKTFVDGALLGSSASAVTSTAVVSLGWSALHYSSGFANADILYGRYYDGYLSDDEITERFNTWANNITFKQDFEDCPPTLANVSHGKIGHSEFEVSTGTWAIGEDSDGKYLKCVSTGRAEAKGFKYADTWGTKTFTTTGATLTKNATTIQIDATTGDIVREIVLTQR